MNETIINQQTLLIEIGTEELPSVSFKDIQLSFEEHIIFYLKKYNINNTNIKIFISSRRIAIIIKNLPKNINNKKQLCKGPQIKKIFDKKKLTHIGKIFLKSNNIKKKDLIQKTIKNTTLLYFYKKKEKTNINNIIIKIIEQLLIKIKFKNPMKWGEGDYCFVRPVHQYIIILNNKPIKHKIFNIKSNNFTYSNKLLNKKIFNLNANNYKQKLFNDGYIIINFNDRKNIITNNIKKYTQLLNSNAFINYKLLNEIASITEYPCLIIGFFHKSYTNLPKEILITTLIKYHKCFPIIKNNKITNKFIIIINNYKKSTQITLKWYNYAVNTRLADITHLYNYEKKNFNNHSLNNLKNIIFQEKLGTIYDKILRLKNIAVSLIIITKKNLLDLLTTISLIKRDLLTKIVMEMPELEGIICSRLIIQNITIKKSIYEYNKPLHSYDSIPKTNIGIIISIIDKIDTITGFFSIHKQPHGTKDPFAIRRKTINIINIIIKNNILFNIKTLINISLNEYNIHHAYTLSNNITTFFMNRMSGLLNKNLFCYIKILNCKYNIYRIYLQINALNNFHNYYFSNTLIIIFKRLYKLIIKNKILYNNIINIHLFIYKEEKFLFKNIIKYKNIIKILYKNHLYFELLKYIININNNINDFFNTVIIINKKISLKFNRLRLINKLLKHLSYMANIHKL